MYSLYKTPMLPLETSDTTTSKFDVVTSNHVDLSEFYTTKGLEELTLNVSDVSKLKLRPGILRQNSAYDLNSDDDESDTNNSAKPRRRVQFCAANDLVKIREIPPRENRSSDEEEEEESSEEEETSDESEDESTEESEQEDFQKDLTKANTMAAVFNSLSPRTITNHVKTTNNQRFKVRGFVPTGALIKTPPKPSKPSRKVQNNVVKPSTNRRRAKLKPALPRNDVKNDVNKDAKTVRRRPPSPQQRRHMSDYRSTVTDAKLDQRAPVQRGRSAPEPRRRSESVIFVSTTKMEKFRPQIVPSNCGAGAGATNTIQAATEALIKELPWLTLPRIHYSPYRQGSAPPTQYRGPVYPRPASVREPGRHTDHAHARRIAWNTPTTSHLFREEPCISQLWDMATAPQGSKSTT